MQCRRREPAPLSLLSFNGIQHRRPIYWLELGTLFVESWLSSVWHRMRRLTICGHETRSGRFTDQSDTVMTGEGSGNDYSILQHSTHQKSLFHHRE